MSKAERTRQFIIEKTAPLFNSKGFDGTSLNDLQEATGLTKGSLYGNFEDKEDIAREAFRYSINKVRSLVKDKLTGVPTHKMRLYALFDFYAQYVFNPPVPGGCPLLNTAVEADDHRTSMRSIVAREISYTVEFLAAMIADGIKAGEFRRDAKPHRLAYTFFCAVEGALMVSRVERSAEAMEIIVQHCKKLVDQICK
jgi:TetR/AcrR family transcriptional regulator, transcriptional repressor for nem operon